jgi:hypothetical protein
MVHPNSLSEQAKSRFLAVFSTLQVGHLLRKAGISKSFGYSSLAVFQKFCFHSSSRAGTGFVFWKAIVESRYPANGGTSRITRLGQIYWIA